MIGSTRSVRVFAYTLPTDMRKGFDGLYGMVSTHLEHEPLSGDMYLFVARNRKRAKVLMWVRTPTESGQCFEVMRTAFRRNADSVSKFCGHFSDFVVMVSAKARWGVRIRSAECPHSVGIENR